MYFMALIYYTYIIFRCDSHNTRRMRNVQGCAPRLWEAQPKQAICRKRKLSNIESPRTCDWSRCRDGVQIPGLGALLFRRTFIQLGL